MEKLRLEPQSEFAVVLSGRSEAWQRKLSPS